MYNNERFNGKLVAFDNNTTFVNLTIFNTFFIYPSCCGFNHDGPFVYVSPDIYTLYSSMTINLYFLRLWLAKTTGF